jgi:hypothetical protein
MELVNFKLILKHMEMINIGPVISIILSMIYVTYGIEFTLFSSMIISAVLIGILFCILIYLIFCFGTKVSIEMNLNLIQVGVFSLSIIMPFCILGYRFFY